MNCDNFEFIAIDEEVQCHQLTWADWAKWIGWAAEWVKVEQAERSRIDFLRITRDIVEGL